MTGNVLTDRSEIARQVRVLRECLTGLTVLAVAVLLFPSVVLAATPRVHAIVGARIVTSPSKVIQSGTVVMRDGLITAVGAGVAVPADARIWEGAGLTVYPGLIDPFVVPKAKKSRDGGSRADSEAASRGAAHELGMVMPERRVAEMVPMSQAQRQALRAAGFTLAQIIPADGVIRGQSAAVGLGEGTLNDNLVRADASQVVSIQSSGSWTRYPGSRQGGIATIRQTFMDAGWYRDAQAAHARHKGRVERPDFNVSLDALQPAVAGEQSVLFRAPDMLAVLAAANIAKEAGIRAYVCGAGDGYKRAAAIHGTGLSLIVPVNYPDAPDVKDPADAIEVSTEVLRHWQNAPGNGAALVAAGVPIALTTNGLKKVKSFRENVAKAIERGLDADAALAAVTVEPARLLGLENRLGTVSAGRIANLTVTSGDLFSKTGEVESVWIDGKRYEAMPPPETLAGEWTVSWGDAESITLIVKDGKKISVKVIAGADTVTAENVESEATRLSFMTDIQGEISRYALSLCRDRICGTRATGASDAGSSQQGLSGIRIPKHIREGGKRADKPFEPVDTPIVMGNTEPWRMPKPEQPDALLIRNATIWTAGPRGTLEGADMLVRRGVIAEIGVGLDTPRGAKVIDAAGAHVMPGIIDEHSHAAVLGGVNECTNSNTSEVRIQDVVNSESVNIYRQLAGGVTMMHMLHGSCNAIGGQCAAIKNRWGAAPDELLVKNIPPTIKFALGENVKGSNTTTGPRRSRYPQTRGGVEQVYRSEFQRALDYRATWKEFDSGKRKAPPRRDLQMDALVEILEGKRQIHCHSYRQDEILMLIRVADDFGFTINTFTHILEGYKVADEMAKHGAAGSAFSDWWAYKFEVYDAIPYNGYLMWDRGVTVAFNSDSPELARRLNTEAAKAVKYGGVPKDEAIKFVTLNPAKMLKIDDRVGSLEKGKEADFAIWSGVPLSPYSRCEQTWVDGRLYFDREADLVGRRALAQEREALIEKAKAAGKGGKGRDGEAGPPAYMYLLDADLLGNDCGSEGEYWAEVERVQNEEVQR